MLMRLISNRGQGGAWIGCLISECKHLPPELYKILGFTNRFKAREGTSAPFLLPMYHRHRFRRLTTCFRAITTVSSP